MAHNDNSMMSGIGCLICIVLCIVEVLAFFLETEKDIGHLFSIPVWLLLGFFCLAEAGQD